MIVIFDVAAPLAAYSVLRSAGLTAVTALLLSGVFPALGVTIGVIQNRRLDVVGALVLTGIVVGTVLGLVSHSTRLLLVGDRCPPPSSGRHLPGLAVETPPADVQLRPGIHRAGHR